MARTRRRWTRWLLVWLTAGALAGLAGACALMYRPGWYTPLAIDYAHLDADNRDLVNLLDRIGVALNHHRAIEFDLNVQQLNRWIVSREQWPEAVGHLDLGPIEDPMILFLGENRVRLAARARQSDVSVVVSVDLRLIVDGSRVVFGLDATRMGAVRVPRGLLARATRDMLATRPEAAALVRLGHSSLPNEWVWPNGKRRFRVDVCRIDGDSAHVRLEPL